MKKSKTMKIVTLVILAIAGFSLIFGSAIMLLGSVAGKKSDFWVWFCFAGWCFCQAVFLLLSQED